MRDGYSRWRLLMHIFKARLSKLEKRIKPIKQLVPIYWADGTFVGETRD